MTTLFPMTMANVKALFVTVSVNYITQPKPSKMQIRPKFVSPMPPIYIKCLFCYSHTYVPTFPRIT